MSNEIKLSKKEIIDLLPHREPMLLIDELKKEAAEIYKEK